MSGRSEPAGPAPPIVHSAAAPNALTAEALRLRPGADGGESAVDPERAGWRYLSFRVVTLGADEPLDLPRTGREVGLVIVAGGGIRFAPDGHAAFELPDRPTPFDGLPSAAYLPPGRSGRALGRPREPAGRVVVAIAEAPSSGRSGVSATPLRITPEDVRVEIRGAGNATRQINHVLTPEMPADRLELVEVLTPSGNWSSWPPHKHDRDDMPREAVLEEIYYYRFRRPEAWGLQRLYRDDRSRDYLWEVRGGDVVLVTDGYHPFVAAHGDDAYYLNALAGDRRTMACSFDPMLEWVQEGWRAMAPDPRVPLVPSRPPA